MADATADGPSGSIKVGGRQAAKLGVWQLEATGLWSAATARVLSQDDYWLDSAGPFDVRLQTAFQTWRWRIAEVHVQDGQARLRMEGVPEIL